MVVAGGSPALASATGLHHVGFRDPSRGELAGAYGHLSECGIALPEATDYGTSQSLHCSDPDGNGIELYWQAPLAEGQPPSQQLPSQHKPLDLARLLAELDTPEPPHAERPDVP